MKKIIISSISLLLVSVLVFSVTSCGKNEDKAFSAEVKADSLDVYFGDKIIQTLEYPKENDELFDLDFAKYHIEFVDLNFDGNVDICLAISNIDSVVSYYCWLADGDGKTFVYSEDVSALKTISISEKTKKIITTVVEDGKTYYVCYQWEDGKLVEKEKIDSAAETLPEDITEAVADESVGVTVTEETKTRSEKSTTTTKEQKKDNKTEKSKETVSTTKKETVTKSENTTATGNSIVLVTGDIDDGWF